MEGEGKEEASLSGNPKIVELEDSGDGNRHGVEEWEGAVVWGSEKRTVSESLNKIDLASLTDWEE